MASVRPLFYNSGNLQQMDDTKLAEVIDQVAYQYSLNPSVTLSQVSSGGNLGTLSDTRLQAGAQSTSATSFPSEATTAEPSTVTVNYARISKTEASVSAPTTDTGTTYPVYYTDTGEIRAMTITDMKDTFIHPAIDQLVSGSTTTKQAGTYQISTSTSLTGNTLISSTPVFVDTRADTSAYSAGSIPETLDQPTTITNYYLHRIDGSNTTYTSPVFIEGSNNLQEFATATFETLLSELIRYTAVSSTEGYKITYSYSSGTNRGTGMANTKLSGSGNRQTRFVNTNDYRAQEFPDGTPTTIDTYFLKINKA